MRTPKVIAIVVLLVAVAVLPATGSVAAGPPAQEPDIEEIAIAGNVASKITYQGRLTDTGGNPLNGSYNLVFQLWNDATAGSQVGSNITKNGVSVSNGTFTVELAVDPAHFNGQSLWLRISVNGQWLTPRQELLPMPFALSLRPGAQVQGSLSGNASILYVTNTYSTSGRGVTGKAADIGVFGWATKSDGHGVSGYTAGSSAYSVYGRADGSSGRGGYFWSTGSTGKGVFGYATGTSGHAVEGWAPGENGHAVEGIAVGRYGFGGVFTAEGTHGKGIWAKGTDYAADLQGKVAVRAYASGNIVLEMGEGLDYSEGFDVSDDGEVAPGTVLVIDSANPGQLTVSTQPYDTKVAGIVSGANGLGSAIRVASEQFDRDVALAGRVYCFVDATDAAIEPGDLLTTSATPGYAMKVTDYARAQGAILGKAMEPLARGQTGQILVLVTLQ